MYAAIYTALCPALTLILAVCAVVDHREGAYCVRELAAGSAMSAGCLAVVTFLGAV